MKVDVAKYRHDGYLVLNGAFTPQETQELEQAWRAVKAELASNTGVLRREARFVVGDLGEPLGTIYKHPQLVSIANQVLGEDVALYYNRLLVKDDTWSGTVEAHQDMPYFHGTTNKMSVFVPVRPFNDATGGLKILAGSHKFGNIGIRGTLRLNDFPQLSVAAPALEPGDLLLLDFLTWHYSEGQKQRTDRPVMQIVYQPADDGSYFKDGLSGPTLVSGKWKTEHFLRYGDGITPDGAATASKPPQHEANVAPKAPSILERFRRRLVAGDRRP